MTMEEQVKEILKQIGENPDREGLLKTPHRVAKAYAELTEGYDMKPSDVATVFDSEGYDEMIISKDIEFYSLCEHHMLPFTGVAHVAYIPNKKIIGLSKLARIVDIYAKRLQVQERMTTQIANAIQDLLNPIGVAIVVEGKHMCQMMRGIKKQNSTMVTSCMIGAFKENIETRNEFLDLIR